MTNEQAGAGESEGTDPDSALDERIPAPVSATGEEPPARQQGPRPGAGRGAVLAGVFNRMRRSLPERPQSRLDLPGHFPEDTGGPNEPIPNDPAAPGDDDGETGTRFGAPGPRVSSRNPIYLGFMGTVGVGCALLVYYIVSNVGQLLAWIAAALFIALGLDPVVRWLEKRQVPRPAGILVSLLLLFSFIAAFIATLIPTIVEQTTQLISRSPGFAQDFLDSPFFISINEQFQIRDRISEEIQNFFRDADAIGGIFGGVVNIGQVVANALFGTLIVLVLTLYFLSSLPAMKRWGYRLAPRSRRKRVELLSEAITRSIGNYVIGQACVAILNATYAFILMSIVGVPFSALLSFVVALLAFVPLIGAMIAGILVTLVALTVGWQTAVVFAIFYFAYLQFEAYFVSPHIMQRAVAVPGSVAVIAVIAGGSLLGVLGVLMAIPTAAAILLLVQELYISRQDRH